MKQGLPRHAFRRRARRNALAVAAGLLGVHGCVSDEPKVRIPAPPDWVAPNKLFFSCTWPKDTDGNGFPDTFTASVSLWDERYVYRSLQAPGQFRFDLREQQGSTLGAWTYADERVTSALRGAQAGPYYEFTMNINDVIQDNRSAQTVDLMVTFIPPTGSPVRASEVVSLRIGRGPRS